MERCFRCPAQSSAKKSSNASRCGNKRMRTCCGSGSMRSRSGRKIWWSGSWRWRSSSWIGLRPRSLWSHRRLRPSRTRGAEWADACCPAFCDRQATATRIISRLMAVAAMRRLWPIWPRLPCSLAPNRSTSARPVIFIIASVCSRRFWHNQIVALIFWTASRVRVGSVQVWSRPRPRRPPMTSLNNLIIWQTPLVIISHSQRQMLLLLPTIYDFELWVISKFYGLDD